MPRWTHAIGPMEKNAMMENPQQTSVIEPATLQATHYKPIGLGDHIAFVGLNSCASLPMRFSGTVTATGRLCWKPLLPYPV
jgi:hypothetical protein